MQAPEHVTFRPGDLAGHLLRPFKTAGAVAKRDLARYYRLTDRVFERWWDDNGLTDEPWAVLVAFVETRDWETVPEPDAFALQFRSFLGSPMAFGFKATDRSLAAAALDLASYPEVVAVVDKAEEDIAAEAVEATSPGASTAGATSAT